jgi:hypothetical protein
MGGYDGYTLRSGPASKYRIGLNIVRTGKIGVKGLFLEYDEYSAEYSPTPSLKPLTRFANPIIWVIWLVVEMPICICDILGGIVGESRECSLKKIFGTLRHFVQDWMLEKIFAPEYFLF